MQHPEIEVDVAATTYDGEHDDTEGSCRLCGRKLPTSYWCDRNPRSHPGGIICIQGVSGRFVDAFEDSGWEYELDNVYWQGSSAALTEEERDVFHDQIAEAVTDWLKVNW